jgi:hypothetical protein
MIVIYRNYVYVAYIKWNDIYIHNYKNKLVNITNKKYTLLPKWIDLVKWLILYHNNKIN